MQPMIPNFRHLPPQTLLIDADDTLWENNIYFIEVTKRYIAVLAEHGIPANTAHAVLLETERRSIPLRGYGSRAFAHAMREAFFSLVPHAERGATLALEEAAHAIYGRVELELLPGVAEGIPRLADRHRLILVTKGDAAEQGVKVARSGLAPFFDRVEIVAEKNADVYRALVAQANLDPASSWMVGNSPRSDINPALQAGLGAVLVPHHSTWELELEEVEEGADRFFVAPRFHDVVRAFAG